MTALLQRLLPLFWPISAGETTCGNALDRVAVGEIVGDLVVGGWLLLKPLFNPRIHKPSCRLAVVRARRRLAISGDAYVGERLQCNDALGRKVCVVRQSTSLWQSFGTTKTSKATYHSVWVQTQRNNRSSATARWRAAEISQSRQCRADWLEMEGMQPKSLPML